MAQLISSKAAIVEFSTVRNKVENDAGKFVGGGGDGLGSTKFSSHASIGVAERTLAVMQGLGRHSQGFGGATVHLTGSHPKYLAPADFVVGA
jgi:hypothetical protein